MANTVLNMHYDFRLKLNNIDSGKYSGFKVPEIDWKLNEAMNLLIASIAFPKMFKGTALEYNQASIDDISVLIKDRQGINAIERTKSRFLFVLPIDYMHHLSSYVTAVKRTCTQSIRTHTIQHDDESEESPFDNSSFEWKHVNIRFSNEGIIGFTDSSFSLSYMLLDYIRKPLYIHAAGTHTTGEYTLPSGIVLSGYQNCELPERLHSKIVDLAVLITTGDLLPANYDVKMAKLQLTN